MLSPSPFGGSLYGILEFPSTEIPRSSRGMTKNASWGMTQGLGIPEFLVKNTPPLTPKKQIQINKPRNSRIFIQNSKIIFFKIQVDISHKFYIMI